MTDKNHKTRGGRAIDVAALDAWIDEAQPGARLVYFHGKFAGAGSATVNARLLAEEERGMLYLVQDHRRTTKDGHDYLAIRSSRPVGQGARGARPASMAAQARAEGERAFRSSGR